MPVGNDILDLNRHSARHRHTDERFIQKILHPKEIILLQQSSNPVYFLWMLWTLKEAAYKYCKQADNSFIFSPKKIYTEQTHTYEMFVLIEEGAESFTSKGFDGTIVLTVYTLSGPIKTYSVFSNNYIHTVAVKDEEDICWGVKKITDTSNLSQSNEARDFVLKSFNNAKAELIFKEKIPFIKVGEKFYATSLSHDGNYVSFAVEMD